MGVIEFRPYGTQWYNQRDNKHMRRPTSAKRCTSPTRWLVNTQQKLLWRDGDNWYGCWRF
jgi:hypothetical protein